MVLAHSLSCSVVNSALEAENVWFFEPHVLPPVARETVQEMIVHDRKKMCVSKNPIFPPLVMKSVCKRENMSFEEPHILCPKYSYFPDKGPVRNLIIKVRDPEI